MRIIVPDAQWSGSPSAQQARRLGFKFLLDFHYSDTWADPGKQITPAAWKSKTHDKLVQAVFEYTREAIHAFHEAGVLPDMVQIGNEVIAGMLWPDGKLPDHGDHFAELVKAGIKGVDAGRGDGPRMIHQFLLSGSHAALAAVEERKPLDVEIKKRLLQTGPCPVGSSHGQRHSLGSPGFQRPSGHCREALQSTAWSAMAKLGPQ